ncbi:hypothetical protein A2246_04585 [candidate division WOR-1 bacterium RIFOXYA2_FULL_37_7]|nr:MAG: hypothetical protein A2246_04585 [candidate division WOR-1 bacterium RIFOXYA2_FULL_37_7]
MRKPVGFDSLSNKRKLSTISKEKNFFNFSSYAENKGFFFKAEELVWNIKSKAIVCKNELWIKKGNISGHAKKLKGDVGLEEIEITGDPVIYIKNHSITTIEAEKFLINGISNTVKAQTHVLIKVDKLTGTTQFLTYNQSTGIIKIKNGIVVKYENYKISADTALYNIKNEKMILSSNGILTRGSSKLSGDVIIIDMKTKKVSIQGKSRAIIPDEEIK